MGNSVKILTEYHGFNRFGSRDEKRGGDDWALPSVLPVLEHFADQLTYNDFSDMNGGQFAPHKSHNKGMSVDAYFRGYVDRSTATADRLINILNDEEFGSRIKKVLVTFSKDLSFFDAIHGVVLDDGRLADQVIRNWKGHEDHFHLEILPSDDLLIA